MADLLVDVGQTGLRARWAQATEAFVQDLAVPGEHLAMPGAPERLIERIAQVRSLLPARTLDRVLVGTTGFDAEIGRAILPRLREHLACRWAILADDAVTAFLGGLGPRPGVTLVAGTGVVALASGDDRSWRRVGGWGWAIDDEGGGFSLGRAGLCFAARAVDRGTPTAALAAAAASRFGSPASWPNRIYGGGAVPSVASFAVDVITLAQSGDEDAGILCRDAAQALARTARTAAQPPGADEALTVMGRLVPPGGLMDRLLDAALEGMSWRPERVRSHGSPLDGVVMLARPEVLMRFAGLFVQEGEP